ncbi:MAG: nitroreductase [Deltaproteobacteria bacterium]|nr:nitroreductase [Deltaproteobacteria bacterium]MBW2085529.1 nitroreductase [Deltaproteobacteria bacterium]
MDAIEAIQGRKSIRGYKPDPVPREILQEIIEIASRAPSSMNTQSWEITVVTGEPLENIKQGNIEMLTAGKGPNPDIKMEKYEGVYRERQVGLAIELFKLMGIGREDKEKRMAWTMRGFRFFDAPAAIILSTDKSLAPAHAFTDQGIIIQTICLTALSFGLGTCIMGQGIMFPDVVRKYTGIPESKQIFLCTPIGYPDPEYPANKLQSPRASLEETTRFIGFD